MKGGILGPHGRLRKIDRDELRRLIHLGHSTAEIATHFAVTSSSIIRILHKEKIPLPPRRYAGRVVAKERPVAAEADAAPILPSRAAELRATGGRYADLRAWAERWGVTETKARQEWHALRLPVAKGGTA